MRPIIFIAIVTTLIASSCKSNGETVKEGSCNNCKEAVIRDYGDPAVDGCGFVVEVDSVIYMPQNLPSEYKKDSLAIQLDYDVKGEARCGMVQMYPAISIKEIRTKQ